MDRSCRANGGWGGIYRILVGKPEGRDHLGDPGKDRRIILRSSGSWMLCYGWIDLAQDRDRWRALVNVLMNIQVS
jgi:hypothetical protein